MNDKKVRFLLILLSLAQDIYSMTNLSSRQQVPGIWQIQHEKLTFF